MWHDRAAGVCRCHHGVGVGWLMALGARASIFTFMKHMNPLYSNLPAFATCCYDDLLVVMSARSRLLLSAVSGVRGVVVVLVLVRPPCAW